MTSPLVNIRVLDMSRILAGPCAGQLLDDYGADVIKIEKSLSGDDTRHWGPPWLDGNEGGESAYFLSANRNKRSVTIDITMRAGQQVIRDLAEQADVLLENYKVGTLARKKWALPSVTSWQACTRQRQCSRRSLAEQRPIKGSTSMSRCTTARSHGWQIRA